ncbi:MAG: DoxX family protein [Rhodoplanes sp.]|uniref:DoxX family protein n=1 Tax=Rhodoplanes sp. TaxID=1968906 RepID=UPI0017FAE8B4|nr:DoxX family protein [Rhodoplanes sp.]NVO13654.1 DoxX family protein [Rhodoplanes sp.]
MLKAKDFDLTNPIVVVRLIAGLFYIPHILFKVFGFSTSLAVFAKMGFEPAIFWLSLALLTETLCAIGLTFNLYTRYVGLMSAGTLAFAVYGTVALKGPGWLWNLGGVEYLVFWGVVSLALAVNAWKEVLSTRTGFARLTAVTAGN